MPTCKFLTAGLGRGEHCFHASTLCRSGHCSEVFIFIWVSWGQGSRAAAVLEAINGDYGKSGAPGLLTCREARERTYQYVCPCHFPRVIQRKHFLLVQRLIIRARGGHLYPVTQTYEILTVSLMPLTQDKRKRAIGNPGKPQTSHLLLPPPFQLLQS